jgi:vesicle-fusing ATPase
VSQRETVAFLAGVGGEDPVARHWLRQATLRLRREVCWLWRERAAQGAGASADKPAMTDLPPFVDAALGSLDLLRFEEAKRAFFANDPTARYLSDCIAEPEPAVDETRRGSFAWVRGQLALSDVDCFVLALALLPAVDSAADAVIARCHNEPQRVEPTLALAQRLWDTPDEVLRCMDPAHPLFRHGLLEPLAGGWGAALRMPAIVARELLYGLRPKRVLPQRRVIPVVGAPDAPLMETAAAAAQQAGLQLLTPGAPTSPEHLRALMTQAWLRGAALYLPGTALGVAHATEDPHAVQALPLADLPITIFVGLHERSAIRALAEPALPALEVPRTDYAARLAAWQRVVPSVDSATLADRDAVLGELARRFRCQIATIERVGAELALLGRAPTTHELFAAARADLDLGALAQPVAPRFKLDELMLPPLQTRQVAEVVTAMNNLARVHYAWGTARAWNEAGLAALFCGPPGTGKTMAAEAIANELELPLFRIDLSQVVNKYIGETEKNLKRLFDAADAADAILFFDEADALFGKRTEVKDAHDCYANLEISYLLERMERFKGLAILATNRRKDLDEAFLRRLRFVIEFPLPGVAERERIWRSVIPPGVDASELDLAFLAQRFALAGGHIRAIVFHACLQSAGAGTAPALTMEAVIRAVQREYDKLERAASLEQYGPYAPLVAAERVAR